MSNEETKVNANSIDLGSDPIDDDFDPFASEDELDAGVVVDTSAAAPTSKAKTAHEAANPLANAIDAAESKEAEAARQNLTEKPPVFEYAGATENIDDTAKTFDELRIEKAADFPELDDGKRVSWSVEYGKITKNVADPKATSIGKIKTEIETSKEFVDALKKAKDKSPVCKVKPKVIAQSKGTATASYKGVFVSMEDAVASGKLITLFPARDGRVYEMRQNELGRFITQSAGSNMLSVVEPGFTPSLPPIPFKHLLEIITLFRKVESEGSREALVNVYWDKHDKNYIIDVPEQTASPVSVESGPNPEYDNERYLHYADVHSHCNMPAFFSETDNRDEKATRVYAVIGSVHSYLPELKVRISNGGTHLEIEPNVVFEEYNRMKKLAATWAAQFRHRVNAINTMLSGVFSRRNGGEAE